jgi:hypothetical protein
MVISNDDDVSYNVPIRRQTVLEILKRHGADVAEFDADNGVYDTYDCQTVRTWLGY